MEPPVEATEPDGPSSFIEAFKAAVEGSEPKAEPKAEEPKAEEPKAEEPKVEPKAEEPKAEEPKEESTPFESRAAKDFKLLKQQRDTAKTELEKLRDEVEQLRATAPADDLDALRKERDELSSRLKAASIERHPEFEQHYTKQLQAVIDRAKGVSSEHAEKIEQLMKMDATAYRDQQMEEVFSELSAVKQSTLGALIARADEVRTERAGQLANANDTYEQMVATQQQQREQMMLSSKKVFDDVLAEARVLEVFQQKDGDEEWNADVSVREELARNIFLGQSDERELARASLWAAAGERYRDLLISQIEHNSKLQKQIEDLQGATPAVSGGSAQVGSDPEKGFIDTMKSLMDG